MPPIAVINAFASEYTTATYFLEALDALAVPYATFHPDHQRKIPKEYGVRLYIDDGSHYCIYPEPDVLKILYIIDTHTRFDLDTYICRFADAVFCAQYDAVEPIQKFCEHVAWLPLGCSMKWHKNEDAPLVRDVAFIGGANDEKRVRYLEVLRERYAGRAFIDRAAKSDIGKIYSGSRIVFNTSANNDINMRFFEALCSGALLVTERVHENGMEELLHDAPEPICVFYDSLDEAVALIDYYLAHEDERKAVAMRGKIFAERHTYVQRIGIILETTQHMRPSHASVLAYMYYNTLLQRQELGLKGALRHYWGGCKKALFQ